jgi:hypothetical protein
MIGLLEGRRCRARRAKMAKRSSNDRSCLIESSPCQHTARLAAADMDKNEEKNAYEVVGVGLDATEADIKKAFRQRSLKTHPDRVRRPNSRP